jgi:uncharacterized protein
MRRAMSKRSGVRSWGAVLASLILLLSLGGVLFAQSEKLPPKPDRYVTDQAGVLDASAAESINTQLEQFEKDTSNQLLVAIYPSLPSDQDLAQYCIDTADAWQVGQKGKDNGAVLFIFTGDHKMFVATGRGLEGALPDALCKNIIDQVIAPQFKQGNYAGGIEAGVNALIAAGKGEYKGTGTTLADQNGSGQGLPAWTIILIIIVFVLISMSSSRFGGGPVIFTSGGWGGGGYGGGGGGFSAGGGSFGGGGAGGSW